MENSGWSKQKKNYALDVTTQSDIEKRLCKKVNKIFMEESAEKCNGIVIRYLSLMKKFFALNGGNISVHNRPGADDNNSWSRGEIFMRVNAADDVRILIHNN